jgi:hypothetical protein
MVSTTWPIFVTAWNFGRDRLRLSYKLEERILHLISDGGIDHRTYYTGPHDSRVIVTQPYGKFADQLRADLTLDNGAAPDVIEASDWGFYYPGHASLVVLNFPSDYAKSMDESTRTRRHQETRELAHR